MNTLAHWIESPASRAAGLTLLEFLWEGAAIAAVLAAVLPWMRSARRRYGAACLALAALPSACALTFILALPEQAHHRIPLPPPAAGTQPAGSPIAPPPGFGISDLAAWAVPVWLAGVLLLEARALAGWAAARRLPRSGVCAAPAAWRRRLEPLAARMQVSRPVALLESCHVDVPVVIGYFRPVILAPVAMLAGMPAGQVEAILLHELAHIWRRDYLVNLLQAVVEALLFYHPAVWWISAIARRERENCCDDLTLAATGDPLEYAAALTALEQTRWAGEPAVAATGGDLMQRIRRILGRSEPAHTGFKPALSAALVVATALAALTFLVIAGQAKPQDNGQSATRYEKWLSQDVVYIITAEERRAFEQLTTDAERDHFIAQFWERRDPTPGTPENEFKEEHYRRIGFANRHFADAAATPGWETDRGDIYILYGPPDEIESHPSGGAAHAYAYEQWLYHHIEGMGSNVMVEFDDPDGTGAYRMTRDPAAAR